MDEGKFEQKEIQETMTMPEVRFVADRGVMWHFVLQNLLKSGGQRAELDGATEKLEDYFQGSPVAPELMDGFRRIRDESDPEVFYWLALQAGETERQEPIISEIERHKHQIKDPRELLDRFNDLLGRLQERHGGVVEFLAPLFVQESESRQPSETVACRQNLQEAINFFRPKRRTTDLDKISIAATGLAGPGEGRMTIFGREGLLLANEGDPDVVVHEFLHTVINPITQKLDLSDEQAVHIWALASGRLRESYGEDPRSILNETLINAYVDNFSKNQTPRERLFSKINKLGEIGFQRSLHQTDTNLKSYCDVLGIKTYQDLVTHREEFYERFYQDEFRERVLNMYESYNVARRRNGQLAFEDYFLANFRGLFPKKRTPVTDWNVVK